MASDDGAEAGAAVGLHAHLDNPGIMIIVITLGVLALRKVMIWAGTNWNWPGLVGFAQ